MEQENKQLQKIPEYDFDIIEIIKVGFNSINGVKGTFLAAFLIYVSIAIAAQIILGIFFPSPPAPAEPNYLNQQIVTILSYPVLMPMIAGIIMLAIKYSRDESIELKSIFNYYHLTGKLSLAAIMIYIMTIIGFILLILPGIYLSIAYIFTLPLIVDKGMDVWEAMELSRKTVTKHWFKVFGLMFILSVAMVLGTLAFGVGLIWAVPLMFVTVYGLLYPLIFDEMEG
ncbi:glycerophosphoryl diester phosphodiesterase membrane domain-containing protein [Sulfurovum sp.]|uniref:glycerophosphoryl diester phosphodiesterase membrane domain-containing protein n=1 Tax=Sulfurovum sp. TaxID=1969726 RepID=UPI002867BC6B|nr:glycerophosphoryl diester phosphodiesterase membrane domain-containing protein [Sulfurovum sp.]